MIRRIVFNINEVSALTIESISIDRIDESGDTATLVLKFHGVDITFTMEDVKDA